MNKHFNFLFGIGVLLLGIVGYLLYEFWLISTTVVGGFLVYLIVDKLLDILERKKITGIWAYSFLTLSFAVIALAGVLFVIIPTFSQLHSLAGDLPHLTEQINQQITDLSETMPFVTPLYETVKEKLTASLAKFIAHSGSLLASLFTIVLMSVTLLASRKNLRKSIIDNIPNDYFEVAVSVGHSIVDSIQKYVFAKSLETIIITIIYAIGFWAIGLPMALLIALIGGLMNLIPYLGPLLTIAPVALIALLQGNYVLLGFGVLVVLIARIIDDALLQTYLIGHFVDVHPFMVVLITLVGGEIMGVLGLVIAIPVYVISKTVILGLYEYLRSVQRHEIILREEESHKQTHMSKRARAVHY
jgi:predicted PurR-regulated permease PerM